MKKEIQLRAQLLFIEKEIEQLEKELELKGEYSSIFQLLLSAKEPRAIQIQKLIEQQKELELQYQNQMQAIEHRRYKDRKAAEKRRREAKKKMNSAEKYL